MSLKFEFPHHLPYLGIICSHYLSQETGTITYNGHKLDEFHVQRTSAYISQTDNHIAELTVRETLDFAASWQGASEGFGGSYAIYF